jgi:DNA-binding CsgD family transcriptional regulator
MLARPRPPAILEEAFVSAKLTLVTPPIPTLPPRAGGPVPPAAGPSIRGEGAGSCHATPILLPVELDEPNELLEPLVRQALATLGYDVAPLTQEPADALPSMRFVALGGVADVARCRVRSARRQLAVLHAPTSAARPFTVAYAVRDDLTATLHCLHGCADLYVVLEAGAAGPHFAYLRPHPAAAAGLTAREADVLALLLARRTNSEIAATLVVAPATVRAHCRAIMRKCGVADRRTLWALADIAW